MAVTNALSGLASVLGKTGQSFYSAAKGTAQTVLPAAYSSFTKTFAPAIESVSSLYEPFKPMVSNLASNIGQGFMNQYANRRMSSAKLPIGQGMSQSGMGMTGWSGYDFGPSPDMTGGGRSGGSFGGGGAPVYSPVSGVTGTKEASSALKNLVTSYNKAYQEARTKNEERYQQLLDIASQTTGQRQADIIADYTRQGSNIRQQLARQGLTGTTIAPTMQMGIEREKQSSLNRLADLMQQTKLGIIERREDVYPEMGLISGLAQMLGQAGSYGGLSALGNLKL